MKKLEIIKNELIYNRNELAKVIEELDLKFTVDEVLNFDSIAFKEIDYSKASYSILANESYPIELDGKIKKKSTRHNIFFCKIMKLLSMQEEDRNSLIENHVKLVKYYSDYKHVFNELKLIVDFGYPEIRRLSVLKAFESNVMKKFENAENFLEYWEYNEFYNKELKKVEKFKKNRAEYLNKKLSK